MVNVDDPGYIYIPTRLNKMLHSLPHVDSDYNAVVDYFRFDPSYRQGVHNLGYIPVILIFVMFLVAVVMLFAKMFSWYEDKNNLCTCPALKFTHFLGLACIILILLCLLMELIILLRGLNGYKTYSLPWLALYVDKYVKAFDEKNDVSKLGRGYGYFVLSNTDVNRRAVYSEPIRLYAQFATEMQDVWLSVKAPQQDDKYLETPFMHKFMIYVWRRFFVYLIFWCIGLGIALCRPNRFWIPCVLGILWCCFMAYKLLVESVMLADICMDPDEFVRMFENTEAKLIVLKYTLQQICEEYRYLNQMNKPRLLQTLYKYEIQFDNLDMSTKFDEQSTQQTQPGETDSDAQQRTARIREDLGKRRVLIRSMLSHIRSGIENNDALVDVKIDDFIKCDRPDHYPEDVPDDSLVILCNNDYILMWLVLQFLCVMVIAIMYNLMLMMHITRPSIIKSGQKTYIYLSKLLRAGVKRFFYEKRKYPRLEEQLICERQGKRSRSIERISTHKSIERVSTHKEQKASVVVATALSSTTTLSSRPSPRVSSAKSTPIRRIFKTPTSSLTFRPSKSSRSKKKERKASVTLKVKPKPIKVPSKTSTRTSTKTSTKTSLQSKSSSFPNTPRKRSRHSKRHRIPVVKRSVESRHLVTAERKARTRTPGECKRQRSLTPHTPRVKHRRKHRH